MVKDILPLQSGVLEPTSENSQQDLEISPSQSGSAEPTSENSQQDLEISPSQSGSAEPTSENSQQDLEISPSQSGSAEPTSENSQHDLEISPTQSGSADSQFENNNSLSNIVLKLEEENKKLKVEIKETKELYSKSLVANAVEMYNLREEAKNNREKLRKEQLLLFSSFSEILLKENSKLRLYTGIRNLKCFHWILSVCRSFVKKEFTLAKESQLLLVFVKIRMALCDDDLAYRFNISRRTVHRILEEWLPVSAGRLRHLIYWPSRKALIKNLPECFMHSVYKDTVCIIDCTEIITQKPSNLKTKNQMWSNYKQRLTMKVLIGITPQGHICYVSECWGGRVSDKELTLKSDFLNYLKPGDVVLADRGFNVQEHFTLEGIRLIVPSYTKGKKQLSSEEVLTSKRISNVRIHIERVIGSLKKFKIISGIVPITSIKYLDCIINICAAVHNLWSPIVL